MTTTESPITILFIPLESRSDGTVHRGANLIAMLRRRYSVIGFVRERNFGEGILALRFLRMLRYWIQTFAYGVRRRRYIDIIFCEDSHAAVGGMLAKVIGKPCIWDIEGEDALYLSAWRKSRLFANLTLVLHWVARKTTNILLVPCAEDRQAYIRRGYHRGERTIVLPLALDFSQPPRDRESGTNELRCQLNLDPRKTVLIYTGQRTEPPYREAAEWICCELVPRLGSLADDVQILLTGRGKVIPCSSPSVTFTGFVPNILDYIQTADICLAPIWREVGVPGKVFEYMSLGKPAVVTSRVRGLRHLTDGWDAMVAATPEEFVEKTVYLIKNPEAAKQIGVRARKTARCHHSYEAVAPKLWRVVEELAE